MLDELTRLRSSPHLWSREVSCLQSKRVCPGQLDVGALLSYISGAPRNPQIAQALFTDALLPDLLVAIQESMLGWGNDLTLFVDEPAWPEPIFFETTASQLP